MADHQLVVSVTAQTWITAMAATHSLHRYLPIAVIIVIALAAFAIKYPGIWFKLLDPAGAFERHQQQALYTVGSADTALSAKQARELFDRFIAGEYAASTALVHQDEKHGLPDEFIGYLEELLIDGDDQHLKASSLIGRLALKRPFGETVEAALAGSVRTSTGGIHSQ